METLRVGIIGTGRPKDKGDATGYAMAYLHALGFQQAEGCEIVACADIVLENAEAFASHNQVPATFTDYRQMLAEAKPDVVSICTWPHLHAEMVMDAAKAGVRAIHCEKPMALTWGEARLMAQQCERRGVQLTFNYQRRFGAPFTMAKQLLKDGAIGSLVRLEAACGDVFDYGTHYVDMLDFYNDDVMAEWVIAQIDLRTERYLFGVQIEDQAICHWKYANGVHAMLATGGGGKPLVGCDNRLVGTDGVIEVGVQKGLLLRVRRAGSAEWEQVDTKGENLHGPGFIERAIADAMASLREGREPLVSARRSLNAAEIVFACFESSRRRGRVDLPLRIEDNPFKAMIDSGEIGVQG